MGFPLGIFHNNKDPRPLNFQPVQIDEQGRQFSLFCDRKKSGRRGEVEKCVLTFKPKKLGEKYFPGMNKSLSAQWREMAMKFEAK